MNMASLKPSNVAAAVGIVAGAVAGTALVGNYPLVAGIFIVIATATNALSPYLASIGD